jgi:hypothetical protein
MTLPHTNPYVRLCDCGSGLPSYWEYDARGIELCRACNKCRKRKLSHYRPDVLTDPNYWALEPTDEEDYE